MAPVERHHLDALRSAARVEALAEMQQPWHRQESALGIVYASKRRHP
jgi:hypothetical protein